MLSDHEQRTLRAVEDQLADEDADFARSFAQRQQRMGSGNRQQIIDRAVHIGTAALGVAALVVGTPLAALQLVVATELAWYLWHSGTVEHGIVSDRPGS